MCRPAGHGEGEFKAGSVLDLADIYGERNFASALDSALYHCLDDGTQAKYLAALHKQARARRSELGYHSSLCV